MSNMQANLKLIKTSDYPKLKKLEKFLDNKELTIIYVHHSHICPMNNHEILQERHVKLVVYSEVFYQTIQGLAKDALSTVAPHHFTETFHQDSTPHLIGLCVCNEYTQCSSCDKTFSNEKTPY